MGKEKNLVEFEEIFRCFFKQSFDGIALYDSKGKVVEWNLGMERITGIKKDAIINSYLWDVNYQLLPKESQTPVFKKKLKKSLVELLKNIPSMESRIDEASVLCPGNVWREIQINTFPVKMKQDCFVGFICRDITTIRWQEKELKEIRDNLEI